MDKKIAEGIVGRARHLLEPADLQKMSVEELVDKASIAMLYCHRTSVQDQSMRASLELARRNKLLEEALKISNGVVHALSLEFPHDKGLLEKYLQCEEALKQNRGG